MFLTAMVLSFVPANEIPAAYVGSYSGDNTKYAQNGDGWSADCGGSPQYLFTVSKDAVHWPGGKISHVISVDAIIDRGLYVWTWEQRDTSKEAVLLRFHPDHGVLVVARAQAEKQAQLDRPGIMDAGVQTFVRCRA